MQQTTYRFSKKQAENAKKFLYLNFNNLLENYLNMNKNIYID